MPRRTIDRRVLRTQGALHAALVRLIEKRGYAAIGVAEICAEAGVGRSTFYAHFTGKDDLKRSGMKTLRTELTDAANGQSGGQTPLAFSPSLLRHAAAHLAHYRAMIGTRGTAISLEVVRGVLGDLVRADVAKRIAERSAREITVAFIVGGYMAVLTRWLDDGAREPAEKIDALLRRMAARAIG
jgi:AcrR family transcriptional regulator